MGKYLNYEVGMGIYIISLYKDKFDLTHQIERDWKRAAACRRKEETRSRETEKIEGCVRANKAESQWRAYLIYCL